MQASKLSENSTVTELFTLLGTLEHKKHPYAAI